MSIVAASLTAVSKEPVVTLHAPVIRRVGAAQAFHLTNALANEGKGMGRSRRRLSPFGSELSLKNTMWKLIRAGWYGEPAQDCCGGCAIFVQAPRINGAGI